MTKHATLGVVLAPTEYVAVTRSFFRSVETVTRVDHLDWTIDGVPLREVFGRANAHWSEPRECTFIPPAGPIDEWVAGSLRALLGGEEAAASPYGFGGGRVGVLFCSVCAGLDCHTMSAEIVVGDDTVIWRKIGYQTDWEPFTLGDDQVGVSATFDRTQYETTIQELLKRA